MEIATTVNRAMRPARLLGVQMGMLTAEEIARVAVVRVDTMELFHEDNYKPVSGGLFSQEMGNVDPAVNYVCPTDGKLQDKCPGYFGYIELVRPVPWYQHLKRIRTTLAAVCRACSAALLPKRPDVHRMLLRMQSGDRLRHMQHLRLGMCPDCHAVQPALYEYVERKDKGWSVERAVRRQLNCADEAGGEQGLDDGGGGLSARKKPQTERNLVLLRVTYAPTTPGEQETCVLMDFEEVFAVLRRISRYDMQLLGFDWDFARPEAMICKNLPVTPPAVRPSVRPDSGQRSEDDQTSIYHSILGVNRDLAQRLAHMRDPEVARAPEILAQLQCEAYDTWSRLAFLVASIYTTKVPGFAPLQQRTGRAFTCIRSRTDGKYGRFRMNLMGKRVNFSARSVIIGAPLNRAQEVSYPRSFAMGLTVPEFVTIANLAHMRRLVANGPGVYPGAKYVAYKDENFRVVRAIPPSTSASTDASARGGMGGAPPHVNVGDVVYRHLQNGDPPLFNRQPSLGKPSIMGMRSRITAHGQTLCMPLDIVTPFNADFDGDEMNLHIAQSAMAMAEAIYPSGVANHIISPTNAVPIIGPHQDAALALFLMSREGATVSVRQAMAIAQHALLVNYTDLLRSSTDDGALLPLDARVDTRRLISLVFPRDFNFEMTVPAGPGVPEEERHVRIVRGQLVSGRLKKSVFSAGTRGILHRLFNDYGQHTCLSVINQLHDVMREFLIVHSFSLSAADFVTTGATRQKIDALMAETMRESEALVASVHARTFENNTMESNYDKFEFEINNLLNRLNLKVGQAVAESLDPQHNVLTTIRAESKGNMANNIQMLAMFGQQNVDGMRVPIGGLGVVLPYFQRYSLGAEARGFLKRPFTQGLTPVEQMYAAFGGRTQLIAMALKTSRAGYIQRRLVKFLEALLSTYDYTVRNGGIGGRIVQFAYGDNFVAPEKLETVPLDFVTRSTTDLLDEFLGGLAPQTPVGLGGGAPDRDRDNAWSHGGGVGDLSPTSLARQLEALAFVVQTRDAYLRHMGALDPAADRFSAQGPVAFQCLFSSFGARTGGGRRARVEELQDVLWTGYEDLFERMPRARPGRLFRACFLYFLNPLRLARRGLSCDDARALLQRVQLLYLRALVPPGKYVGVIAGQSCGSSNTQSALNSSKTANGASRTSMRLTGIERMEELMVMKANPQTPAMTIFLHRADDDAAVAEAVVALKFCLLRDLVRECSIIYAPYSNDLLAKIHERKVRDPFDNALMERYATFSNRLRSTDSGDAPQFGLFPCVLRFEFDEERMLRNQVTLQDIVAALKRAHLDRIDCVYSAMTDAKLVLRVALQNSFVWKKCGVNKKDVASLRMKTVLEKLQAFQNDLLDGTVLKGVRRLLDVTPRAMDVWSMVEGEYVRTSTTVLETYGSNLLEVLAHPAVDPARTTTNHIQEIYRVLGKFACRAMLIQEIKKTLACTNFHNVSLLVDKMLYLCEPGAVNRTGIRADQISTCTKATFETQTDCMTSGARAAAFNPIDSPSMAVMTSARAEAGTNVCSVLVNHTDPLFATGGFPQLQLLPAAAATKRNERENDDEVRSALSAARNAETTTSLFAQASAAAATTTSHSHDDLLLLDDDDIEMVF